MSLHAATAIARRQYRSTVATQPPSGVHGRVRRWWRRLADAVSWTPPTSTEIGTVAKCGLAAGLSWWLARVVTGVPAPVLAPLTAVVVVQVSVRASVLTALQRSAAVVLGVLVAVAIGDALSLNGLTVGVVVAVSLGIAQLVLRLPAGSARQVPISILVVLTAVAASPESSGWSRAVDTVVGAAVGVAVSLVLPASRLVDARQTLARLADSLSSGLEAMGSGLQQRWSTDQTEGWRRQARTTRERLVSQAVEAVGKGREAARWNVRDRRHIDVLGRYEGVMPRLERTAIGMSVISRGSRRSRAAVGHDPLGNACHGRAVGGVGSRCRRRGARSARRTRRRRRHRSTVRGPDSTSAVRARRLPTGAAGHRARRGR